ncbi:polyprenyl synthetase family protein [Caldalkalibacillus salinus]|uniref:polyprenyl synthetase family protein n=1 Tax=Caldalkalibacillus salinus TaxID=2803787 RepID=UPI0019224E35|nr:polyprenyl synthetase family protein [Caldalkalibacillus salinus]
MNLLEIYKELKKDIQHIEEEIHGVLDTQQKELKRASVHLLNAGGKRIRPVFVLLGGKNGQYDIDRLAHVAVALELIHMATLVHDDVVDHADTRRGKPTVKAKWNNKMAMYTGDYIISKALQRLTAIDNPLVHQILSKAIVDMCMGEVEQIKAQYEWNQTMRQYFLRIKRKTALLMAVSCQLGGLAGHVSEQEARALYRFGYYVGMAFQITDDILDFTGTEKQLGKPAGSDLMQGNITLPVLACFHDHEVRQEIITEASKHQPDMERVIQIVKLNGGIQYANQIAQRYLAKARQSIHTLSNSRSQDMFYKITQFVEQRHF